MARAMSPFMPVIELPESATSSTKRSSARADIASAKRCKYSARLTTGSAAHAGCARSAARTARSTSSGVPRGTRPMGFSLAGLMLSIHPRVLSHQPPVDQHSSDVGRESRCPSEGLFGVDTESEDDTSLREHLDRQSSRKFFNCGKRC